MFLKIKLKYAILKQDYRKGILILKWFDFLKSVDLMHCCTA